MKGIVRTTLFLLMLTTSYNLPAQTLNNKLAASDKMQFGVSFDKPFYKGDVNMSTLSGVYQLHFNLPVSSKLNIVGDIPYVTTSYEYHFNSTYYSFNEKYNESGLGNIYIGLQTVPRIDSRSLLSFGVYLPTADEKSSFNGAFTNYYDILKYIPNTFGLSFSYSYLQRVDRGFNFGFEAGPDLMIPTKSDNGSETEFFMHYGAIAGIQFEKLGFNVEYLGVAIISEHIDTFTDRLIHLVDINAHWNEANVTPNIFYRIYLKDEMRQMIDGIFGVGVSVSL